MPARRGMGGRRGHNRVHHGGHHGHHGGYRRGRRAPAIRVPPNDG